MATAPVLAKQMMQCTSLSARATDADAEAMIAVRESYVSAAPTATMPPPATLKGMGKMLFKMLKGEKPTVFLDKLGERLAFERTGTRLYQAVVGRFEGFGSVPGGPQAAELQRHLAAEARHFELLRQAILAAGGDPTAVTPCADATAVESHGLMQVLTDPRTTPAQCLQAILIAELTDNDGWMLLCELADSLGYKDMLDRFQHALEEEEWHLERVRDWLASMVFSEARLGGRRLAQQGKPRRRLNARSAAAHPSKEAASADAIEMLTGQHRRVEKLFSQLERAGSGRKRQIFLELADALTIHAEIEEQHFYPVAASISLTSEVREAHKEHAEMKRAIGELLEMDPADDAFDEKIEELKENVEHHVAEEESELFPKCVQAIDAEWREAIGQEMMASMVSLEGEEIQGSQPEASRSR